ncbi:MAG: peptidase S1 [Rhodospirillaceae bacterium]|nr:peptidase S1 [Rhodospirillaceae bacterium]
MKITPIVAGGLAVLAVAATAVAQNWQLDPTYGSIQLTSGFQPDPHSVVLQAGGSIDASNLGPECRGLIADAPDYDLVFEPGALPLNIYVTSDSDTTLVINGPDQQWYCSDDVNGLNPLVSFSAPQAGLYDIWVGSFGGLASATLHISELPPR